MAGLKIFRQNIDLIKKASERKVQYVVCFSNQITLKTLDIFWDRGLILGYRFLKKTRSNKFFLLQVFLKFTSSYPAFRDIKIFSNRKSKFFFSWKVLASFRSSFPLVLVHTSKGLLTNEDCLKLKLGGSIFLICL